MPATAPTSREEMAEMVHLEVRQVYQDHQAHQEQLQQRQEESMAAAIREAICQVKEEAAKEREEL